MNLLKYIITGILAIVLGPSYGQESITLSLNDCLEKALTDNPQLALQELQLQQEFLKIRTGRRFLLPEINAYAHYYQYLDDRPVFVFPESGNETLSGFVPLGAPMNFYSGITVNQHLFDARMLGAGNVREKAETIREKRKHMNEEEIRYSVIKTFYQIRILTESMELINYNRQRLEQLTELTRSAVENEMVLPVTLDELMLRQEELVLAKDELENRQEEATGYMRFLCQLPADVPLVLVEDGETSASIPNIPDWQDSSKSTGWELLELQREMTEESLHLNTAKSYPTLDLMMAFQWLQQEGYGDLFTSNATWFNQHLIGLKLNIPILNPESRRTAVQEMQIQQDILTAQQELLSEKKRLERQKAIRDLQLKRKELDLAARRVALTSTQFEQSEVRHAQQFDSLRELLEAEERLRSARMEEQRKKIEYIISILEVYRAYDMLHTFRVTQ